MMYEVTIFLLISFVSYTSAINGECVSLKNNANNEKFELVYEWKYINFTWPSRSAYETAVTSGKYVPEHNAIVGVKFYNEKIYLALPKARPGAPVTLARVDQFPEDNILGGSPLLSPYPSWRMNTDSGCGALHNVQSMEIDRKGIMWTLDGRRVDKFGTKCPPKITLLDLNSNGKTVKNYIVPNDVCKHDDCFLNDLVLDEFDGGYAYITDTSLTDPGLIVYSRKQNRAWKIRDQTMHAQPEALNFTVNDYVHQQPTPIDGIALAPSTSLDDPNRIVYYTALTGYNFYGINSSVLRNEKLSKSRKVKDYIKDFGPRIGPTDGLMMDTEGDIYFGILTENAVGKWNTKKDISTAEIIDQNSELMVWPDSFGFDPYGNLYLVTNNIGSFFERGITTDKNNFRLWKMYTGTCSYQH